MFLSVFEMFKVGIGPSSSHTMGPMLAAARFLDALRGAPFTPAGLRGSLHGSLAFTGIGHASDRATILGLAGFRPEDYDAEKAEATLDQIRETHTVRPPGLPELAFHPKDDLLFDFGPNLPGHANGMILMATDAQGDVIAQETYYSVGGGFVLTEAELAQGKDSAEGLPVPYPFKSAAEMLEMAETSGKSIARMKRENELARGSGEHLHSGVARIWQVMDDCIERGLSTEGDPSGRTCMRQAPRQGHPRRADRRAGHQPERAAQDQRLDERLCDGSQRRERRRRTGGDRPHQWGCGRRAGGDQILARPRARCA